MTYKNFVVYIIIKGSDYLSGNCNRCGEELCTKNIIMFRSLPMEIQRKLILRAKHIDYKKNDIIINENDKLDSIIIIREGKIKLNKYDLQGKEYIFDILIKGDSIGEELFFEEMNYPYNCIAVEDVKICKFSKSSFIDLIKKEPETALDIMKNLNRKLIISNENLSILHENNALKKVAMFLIYRSKRLEDKEIHLSIDDIAAIINLRRETVSRKISELQEEKIVERVGNKKIKILNIKKLEELL